jgi:hypothetical protein
MSATLRLAAFASITTAGLAATATTASAQEGPPGACACAIPAAPVVVVAADPLPKWGIGLRATSMTLAPESNPDAETEYGGGGLQVRYRLTPRWQLEVSLDHFQERLENGDDGTRQLDSVTLAALYHFRPHARWDWYLLAGFGGTGNGDPEISDEAREASQMGHIALGAGLERRFGHFGIGAELRVIGMAPPEADERDVPLAPTAPSMTVPAAEPDEGISGGQFTIAGTYYF